MSLFTAETHCPEHFTVALLSLFLDNELSFRTELHVHLQNCAACQDWLATVKKQEETIRLFEKGQDNFIVLEIFDVIQQRRQALELGWEPVSLLLNDQGQLVQTEPDAPNGLRFFLKSFWYGQTRVYVEYLNLGREVILQRGHRYVRLAEGRPQRIIESDGVLLNREGRSAIKLTFRIPQNFKDNSITRKYKSLAAVSSSFVRAFFQESSPLSAPLSQWQELKTKLTIQDLGVYLMRLNSQASYKKIARAFHISHHAVAKIIAQIRHKLTKK